MSDSNTEDDLISQDDIDRLLDASSVDEAESLLEPGDDILDDTADDLGELSQDDIDSLLKGSGSDEDPGDESGELSQDDIDRLMNMGGDDEPGDAETADFDEDGELSQDDIDRLMGGGPLREEADDDPEEMELISQEDIQRLMNTSAEDDSLQEGAASPDLDGYDDLEPLSQADIDGLTVDDIPENPAPLAGSTESELSEDDSVIDESEALDVAQNLITQETIDQLIQDVPDPEMALEEPEQDAEPDLSEPVILNETMADEKGREEDPLDAPDMDEEELGPDQVTQDDIDSLLQDDGVEDDGFLEDEDDILISQDDIDTLLMAADQEDEDVLGDLAENEDVPADLYDPDVGDLDQKDEPVVLESVDEEILKGEDEARPAGEKAKGFKSKLVLVTASVLLVLGIVIPTGYFLFFSKDPVAFSEKQAVPVAENQSMADIESNRTSMDVNPISGVKKSGTIALKDFIIMTSVKSSTMAYILADISIDYADPRAYREINGNLSFYRDLIYETIQKNFTGEKQNNITTADLIWEVENALKKVLPSHYIKKVGFQSFKTS